MFLSSPYVLDRFFDSYTSIETISNETATIVDRSTDLPDASFRSLVRSLLDFFLFLKELIFWYCSSTLDTVQDRHLFSYTVTV